MRKTLPVILIVLGVPLLATTGLGVAASINPVQVGGKNISCDWETWRFGQGNVQALTTSGCISIQVLHVGPFEVWG